MEFANRIRWEVFFVCFLKTPPFVLFKRQHIQAQDVEKKNISELESNLLAPRWDHGKGGVGQHEILQKGYQGGGKL